MAWVEKTPTGRWRAGYRDSAGKQVYKTFDRKIDAKQWVDGVSVSIMTGSYVDPQRSKITVGEWSERWLAGKVRLKASTRDRYLGVLTGHVLPRWGKVPLAKVGYSDVQTWVAELAASGLAAATVQKIHRVLSMALTAAVKDGRLAKNPATGVDLPRIDSAAKRYLSADQVHRLGECSGPGRLIILVLAYTGIRWGELAALRVGRVELLRRRIHIAESVTEVVGGLDWGLPKDHERRWVPLPRFLIEDLAAHLVDRAPNELVFPSAVGTPLRVNNARRGWFDRAAAEIGVPGLTPQELRHTAASLAVSAGANVKAVQRMLGHAKASMTLDVYADLFDDDLEAVADRLDVIARAAIQAAADSQPTATVVRPIRGTAPGR